MTNYSLKFKEAMRSYFGNLNLTKIGQKSKNIRTKVKTF